MLQPGRQYTNGSAYRYGFNGKENDKDISEGGQDYGMRIYDTRIGKFLSVDALTPKYPELTPYQFASNCPIAGIDLDGLELVPRFKQSDPLCLTEYSIYQKEQQLENSRAGKVIRGVWNTAAGAVGMFASCTYMAASDGAGAAVGGVAAFDLSASTTSIGIMQITEAFASNDPKNDFLHKASTLPGLIAYGVGSKNAALIDAFSGLLPTAFTSGNGKTFFSLSGFLESGFGVIDAIKEYALTPSVSSTIQLLDALKGVNDIRVESMKLYSNVYNPSGAEAAMNSNPILLQTLAYTISYKVAKGDNLNKIAKKFGVSVETIAIQNNIKDINNINAGQKLSVTNVVSGKTRVENKKTK